MKLRHVLFAVLALPACTSIEDEEIELAVSVTRAEIHVDPAQPDALAEPMIHLDVYGGVNAHYIAVDTVRLSLDNGLTQDLDLTLEQAAMNIPANSYFDLALVNHGTRNSELATLCQTAHPVTVWVDTPGFDAGGTLAPGRELSIFCP